ncbi:CopG family transcriptional regulator [Pseudochelatococcus sp. B33]
MNKTRLNIFIEPDHARRLRRLAAMKGESQSAIVAAALSSFLSSDGADRREAAIIARLDRLSHQFDRLERDQTILIETLALFIRYTLSVSAPLPETHQKAARAQGRIRFNQFIEQLGRHLQRGGSLVRQVHQEIMPDENSFHALADDDEEADTGGTAAEASSS